MNTAIIILAAGKSSRMGFPKQALPINGKTLIKRTLDEALNTRCFPVTVVVGANKKDFIGELQNAPVTIIDNPQWEKGMGSSIKMGLIGTYLVEKNVEAVIFCTVDMPFITTALFEELIAAAQPADAVAAASVYGNTLGVPALFKRELFEEILNLPDDQGAKHLLEKHLKNTKRVHFPNGIYDLDTPADVRQYIDKINAN